MNPSTISCAIVTDDPELRERVARILNDPANPSRVAIEYPMAIGSIDRSAGEMLLKSEASLIFLDAGADAAAALRFASYLSKGSVLRTFLLAGQPVDAEVLMEAMRIGAAEYLAHPVDPAALEAALLRTLRRMATSPAGESVHDRQPGRIVSVFSAKGGTGVTTTAVNLAVALRRATGKPTLLLDLDVELGGAATALGLQPRYTVFDAVRSLHRLDDNLLSSLLTHHDTGIDVLASPAVPNSGDALTRDQVWAILDFVRRRYAHVVIDLARAFNPISMAVFDRADELLLLTTPELGSLRNTKKALPIVTQAAGGPDCVRVVVNRCTQDDVISIADVSTALGVEVFGSLSGDPAVSQAASAGLPIEGRKRSRYSRDLDHLVQSLGGVEETRADGSGNPVTGGVLSILRRLASGRAPDGATIRAEVSHA